MRHAVGQTAAAILQMQAAAQSAASAQLLAGGGPDRGGMSDDGLLSLLRQLHALHLYLLRNPPANGGIDWGETLSSSSFFAIALVIDRRARVSRRLCSLCARVCDRTSLVRMDAPRTQPQGSTL